MKKLLCLAVSLALLGISGCDLILGPNTPLGKGTLSIGFGADGGSSGARSVSAATLSTLRYELVLFGPDSQRIPVSLAAGEDTFTRQVALGEWSIEAKAYAPPDDSLFGTGSRTITVRAGDNPVAVVPMTEVSGAEVPEEKDTQISDLDLTALVPAPLSGAAPVTTISAAQYEGTIAWQETDGTSMSGKFILSTVYQAVINLTAKTGYVFDGIEANSFTHAGAESVTSEAGSGDTVTVTITFPETAMQPVTGITGLPLSWTVGVTLALNGTVSPANATNQAIVWSVKTDGGTGASITGNTLSTTGIGIVALTATIADGTAVGTNYTQDFNITIIRPVTNITGVATSGTAGTSLTLAGTVAPTNATNQTITWSVKTPGGTGASITGNTLSTTGAGTVEVTATIADGTAAGTDYTQDFNITILSLPAYTLKPVPAGTVTSGMAWGSASNYPLPQTVSAFYMGETEITYELYEVVYTWATDTAARGANVYILPDPGRQGGDSTLGGGSIGTNQHPVTTIRWRDAVVWCNAYSEMSGKTPVYQYGGAVLRESEIVMPAGYGKAENSTQDPAANGYRLPTEAEWEYAARGGVPGTGTPWTYIYAGSDNKNEVAVHSGNSGSQTAAVKSMTGGSYNGANSLGLYDMSGNVEEMCWDVYSTTYRVFRGGGWNVDTPLADRTSSSIDPIGMLNVLGFRVVCAP